MTVGTVHQNNTPWRNSLTSAVLSPMGVSVAVDVFQKTIRRLPVACYSEFLASICAISISTAITTITQELLFSQGEIDRAPVRIGVAFGTGLGLGVAQVLNRSLFLVPSCMAALVSGAVSYAGKR